MEEEELKPGGQGKGHFITGDHWTLVHLPMAHISKEQ